MKPMNRRASSYAGNQQCWSPIPRAVPPNPIELAHQRTPNSLPISSRQKVGIDFETNYKKAAAAKSDLPLQSAAPNRDRASEPDTSDVDGGVSSARGNAIGSSEAIAYNDCDEMCLATCQATTLQISTKGNIVHWPVSSEVIKAAIRGACVEAASRQLIPITANRRLFPPCARAQISSPRAFPTNNVGVNTPPEVPVPTQNTVALSRSSRTTSSA